MLFPCYPYFGSTPTLTGKVGAPPPPSQKMPKYLVLSHKIYQNRGIGVVNKIGPLFNVLKPRSGDEPQIKQIFRDFFVDEFSDYQAIFPESAIFRIHHAFGARQSRF